MPRPYRRLCNFYLFSPLLDTAKLDRLIAGLAASTLRHEDVFNDHGHGALVYEPQPMHLHRVGVTGPRRSMLQQSRHPVYFAVPFGDMMIAGCYGLIRAWVDIYPDTSELVLESLRGAERGAPWDAE